MGSSNSTNQPRNQNRDPSYPNRLQKTRTNDSNQTRTNDSNQTRPNDTNQMLAKTIRQNEETAEMNEKTAQVLNNLKTAQAQSLREDLLLPNSNIQGGSRPSFNHNRYRNPAVSVIGMY